MSTETESVYLSKVTLTNYKSFKGENEFNLLDENGNWVQWNILLGNNNVGKTNFLKAIATIQGPGKLETRYTKETSVKKSDPFVKLTYYNLQNYRYDLKFYIDDESKYVVKKGDKINMAWGTLAETTFGYGVSRRSENNQSISSKNNKRSATLFDSNETLINIEAWIIKLDYAHKNSNFIAYKRLNKIKELFISDLFPEIMDFRFVTKDDETFESFIEFQTKEGWFRLEELGYGYQSSMSWLVDFSKRMFERYADSDNPLAEPAIVLIDEIDLHLHPSWQKNVIGFLSKMFPKTQFIVTTHSPQIVQSAEKLNLFVLHKEGSATKYKKFSNQSFKGWSVEEILEEVMLIENGGHSDEYQGLINQFDKALDKNNKKEAEAVYQKLDEILHPASEERKILELQLSQIVEIDG